MTHITEIIPHDLPEWAKKAFDEGQLFNRLTQIVDEARDEGYKAGYKKAGNHLVVIMIGMLIFSALLGYLVSLIK